MLKKIIGLILLVCLAGLYLQIGAIYLDSLNEASSLILQGEYHKLNLFQKFQVSPFKIVNDIKNGEIFWIIYFFLSLFFWLSYLAFFILKGAILFLANNFYALLLLTIITAIYYFFLKRKEKQKNKGC